MTFVSHLNIFQSKKMNEISSSMIHTNEINSVFMIKKQKTNICRSNANKITLCFDLQEILMTPYSNASVLFYKRKLNTFNLSIIDLSNNQAICNVWKEGIAARGSYEKGSCIFHTLKTAHERGVKYISLYSDSSWGAK